MGCIHYITPDNKIKTVQSDKAPSMEELKWFIKEGKLVFRKVFPNRKQQWLIMSGNTFIELQGFNHYATLLAQELMKYQNGLKKIGEEGSGEEPVTSIEALAYCDPMPGGMEVYGPAVYLEDLEPRGME
jgi:hypothetical protein